MVSGRTSRLKEVNIMDKHNKNQKNKDKGNKKRRPLQAINSVAPQPVAINEEAKVPQEKRSKPPARKKR